jgi:hypothetical protein
MRDIRNDLEERRKLIEGEISALGTQFEQSVAQLKKENDSRLTELKAELAVIGVLFELEQRRMPSPVELMPQPFIDMSRSAPDEPMDQIADVPTSSSFPVALSSMEPPREALKDFIARMLVEIGPGSPDDLGRVAVRDGYFSDAERARPNVHAAVMDLLRHRRIRRLPNGTLAPAMVSQILRSRHA